MADSSNETEFNNNHNQNDAEVEVNEKTATKWKKRKNPSFTNEYFEKIIDPKTGSSTGNLIQHLDLVHKIVSQENEKKKPRTTKITDYVKSTQPHPPHIQKQREEGLLKWMLRTNQPLSAVTNEAYKEMINIFDSSFITIPEEKKIRTMIGKTTWITPDLKIKDVMLEINYIPSPHTAVVIADSLHKIISDWKLEDCISSIITDNGANMVASIPFLKIKPGCSDILRLPCTAHTLQLAIIKGLTPVEVLVARVRRLVRFFVTQKQVERLTAVQKKLGYNERRKE
ncbi:hypothetical protein RirG_204130 [Rhizophagus irregularis DAOM 197198w]|uniref:Zinc finger bed domain-containing protein 1-like n=1 Tax=Rhizophagus irregularis (strain DAOM 197198w) TaxID=1432141 RepID=A0A015IU04_RHIIW|nr:hypothetical protein RirG_204130 [Rhizophagus irregularis DAOM 197198w]